MASTRTGPAIPTSELLKAVRALSGKDIPEPTIRASLHKLAKDKEVKGKRDGREKVYRLAGSGSSSKGAFYTGSTPPRARTEPTQETHVDLSPILGEPTSSLPAPTTPVETTPHSQVLAYPHKLAVGEVLVLHVDETGVETATNLHGKVVLERHIRPKL